MPNPEDRILEFTVEIVERIPHPVEEEILYLSNVDQISAHRCFCGCGFVLMLPVHIPGVAFTHLGFSHEVIFCQDNTCSMTGSIVNEYCNTEYTLIGNEVIFKTGPPGP